MNELYYSAAGSTTGSVDTLDQFYSCSESEGENDEIQKVLNSEPVFTFPREALESFSSDLLSVISRPF